MGDLMSVHFTTIPASALPGWRWIQLALGLALSAFFAAECAAQSSYLQHNLVSDLAGVADHTDTNLVNPWAIAFGTNTGLWISDNRTGRATVYDGSGTVQSVVVTVPTAGGGTPPSAPTGIVFNSTTNFPVTPGSPARFIFSTAPKQLAGTKSLKDWVSVRAY